MTPGSGAGRFRAGLAALLLAGACATGGKTDPGAGAAADSARAAEVMARERARIAGEAGREVPTDPALAAASTLPEPLPSTSDSVRIAILATNDVHGGLLPQTPSWADGDTIGGAAVLAAYVRAVEARYPGATLWLDGGDVMQGTLISNLTAGRSTVDVLSRIGLDAAAIGNHDFDWTVDTLRARMADAAFPWISANVFRKDTGERPDWAEPIAWLETAGLTVAVVGASTVQTPATTMPANVAAYEFRDIAESVNALATELERADLVLIATHSGAIAGDDGVYVGEIVDAARALTVPVDAIVSGHTHSRVETVVNGIPIVQARSSATALGAIVLTYDRSTGRVVDHAIRVFTTAAEGVARPADIAALVAGYAAEVEAIASRPIATLAAPLPREREEESPMAQLIADAQRAAVGAQVALMNPGGVRDDLDAGPVTYADVFRIQPFQNVLVRLTLSGEQLRLALEAAVEDRLGQVSGIRFAFDPTRPVGERVREATLETGEPVVRDGRAVSPEATYVVVANNFMASGGDSYRILTEAASAESTGLVDSDVLAEYLAGLPQPVSYGPQGRVTRLAPWPPRTE